MPSTEPHPARASTRGQHLSRNVGNRATLASCGLPQHAEGPVQVLTVTTGHVPFRLFDDDTRVESVLQLRDGAAHLIALAGVKEKKSRGTGNEIDGVGLAR